MFDYKAYYDLVAPKYISWEFYQQYVDYNIPFGAIGDIVDCRTYRRFIPQLGRRERAIEAFLRVVEYNISLVEHLQTHDELKQEAELFFDNLANLRLLPSNRSRWVGGTESVRKHPASIFNCSATAINRLDVFGEIFELLCLGVGVGYRVFDRDISKLPSVTNKSFSLKHDDYESIPKPYRLEETDYSVTGSKLYINVGDSRQGWRKALMLLLEVCFTATFKHIQTVSVNYDSVRPFGERIYGFGGTASGPDALRQILTDVYTIVQECPSDRLRSIDAMDIPCAIAKGVVAGSSRRSALMVWFEERDELCKLAKTDLGLLQQRKSYRYQANITECIGSKYYDEFIYLLTTNPTEEKVIEFINSKKPNQEYFNKSFETIQLLGEPGVNNFLWIVYKRYLAAIKWRPNKNWIDYIDVLTNPCHEVSLSSGLKHNSGNFCNLTVINLPSFVVNGTLDYSSVKKAVEFITRIGLRQTEVTIPMSGWNETQQEERLLGVDTTNGFQNVCSLLNWSYDSPEANELRHLLRKWANDEATRYAAELGVNRPLLVTTSKPNGTTAEVLGTAPGIHWEWSPYYLRRMRITSTDPLAKTLRVQGYNAYPEVYSLTLVDEYLPKWKQLILKFMDKFFANKSNFLRVDYYKQLAYSDKLSILNRCNAIMFEFPIKAQSTVSAKDVKAIDQLESQRLSSVINADHMVSVTVTVQSNEWSDVSKWVHDNWLNGFTTAAFLAYSDKSYPLMPYESVTSKEYDEQISKLSHNLKQTVSGRTYFKLDNDLLDSFEKTEIIDDSLTDDACKNGCPIR